MEKTENTGSTRSFFETANILYAVKFHRYSICLTGHFKITTWLILIRVIRVLEANPSNPQSGGLRPGFRVIVRMPECSQKNMLLVWRRNMQLGELLVLTPINDIERLSAAK